MFASVMLYSVYVCACVRTSERQSSNFLPHKKQMERGASGGPQGHGKMTRCVEKMWHTASWEMGVYKEYCDEKKNGRAENVLCHSPSVSNISWLANW